MADHSAIEWTDATWNPVRGCTRVSPGCGGPGDHGGCYAEAMAARFSKSAAELAADWKADPKNAGKEVPEFKDLWGYGFAEMRNGKPRWTGRVVLIHDQLDLPLRWRKPRRIFVNSTSDLFHEALLDDEIAFVIAYIAASYWHTHQVLTKRPERARDLLSSESFRQRVDDYLDGIDQEAQELGLFDPQARRTDDWRAQCPDVFEDWPLSNLWLGTSCERQPEADERLPFLVNTPAAVRFVSYEPALGPLLLQHSDLRDGVVRNWLGKGGIDWAICGGESGKNARPMHPDWARSLRDQCAAAGVPFFFKQWGEWRVASVPECVRPGPRDVIKSIARDPSLSDERDVNRCVMIRVGKKAAGRLLDGKTHDAFLMVAS